jgi:Coenzyme PQQ synthesis protein D (PqqD)
MGNAAFMLSADRATPKLAGVTETGRLEPGPDPRPPAATTVWRRAPSAAYVETPRRAVVLDLDHLDHPPYVLEGSAAQIWGCVDGDRTEAEIVADLAEAFELPGEQVAADVRDFLDRLVALGLVVAGG